MARKKRPSSWHIFIRVFIVITIGLFLFGLYEALTFRTNLDFLGEEDAAQTIYHEFGVAIPENYEIHGIDVSKYQRTISWNSVASMQVEGIKIGFAFMKATEGTDLIDHNFERNWKEAKASGIVRGAYHFFLATVDGVEQAKFFLEQVHFEKGDLPPVIDIEHLYSVRHQKMKERLLACLEFLQQTTGVSPIIYTSVGFYKSYLGDDFDKYPLWIAHYQQVERPGIHRQWSFWQHNESGNVSGIGSKVDLNVFSGDSTAFKSLLIP